MRTLLVDPPPEVQAWLRRRQQLGQDLYDEVWEGTYLAAPAPHPAHGDLDEQIVVLLKPHADATGLRGHGPLNVGEPEDYRVPDRAYTRDRPTTIFVPSVVIAVEIRSPGDASWDKLNFYGAHGVEEVLIVDPTDRSVHWLMRDGPSMQQVDGSRLLGLSSAALAAQIDWPPL